MNIKRGLETAQQWFIFIGSFCLCLAVLSTDEGWESVILALVGLLFGALSLVAKRLQSSIVV